MVVSPFFADDFDSSFNVATESFHLKLEDPEPEPSFTTPLMYPYLQTPRPNMMVV